MASLTAALVQARSRGADPDHALREGERACREAARNSHLAPLDIGNGHSVAFSGTRFDRDGNPLEHTLVEAGEEEELLIATFDLDALRAYRAYEIQGDAYRKPAFYNALSDDTPLPVFARADSRRAPLPRAG